VPYPIRSPVGSRVHWFLSLWIP